MQSVKQGEGLTVTGWGKFLALTYIAQQTIVFVFDHRVALTHARLQARPVKHGDVAAAVANEPRLLQMPGGFGDAFAAHAEHAGNQFLRHGQFIRGQAIEGQ